MYALIVRTLCTLYLFIVLNCVASAVAAIIAGHGEWVSLAIVLALGSMKIFTVLTAIYCCTSYDKCTYCKSLWIKASAKCPKCKCKCKKIIFRQAAKTTSVEINTTVSPVVNLSRILPVQDPAPLKFALPVFRNLFGQNRYLS